MFTFLNLHTDLKILFKATLILFLFLTPKYSYAADYSLTFDGSDDYVEVPFDTSMNPTADFSVSAWVKATSIGGAWQSPVTSRSRSAGASENRTAGYMLYISPTGSGGAWSFWGGNHSSGAWSRIDTTTQPAVTDPGTAAWEMMTVTYKESSTSMKLYINGELIASTTAAIHENPDKVLRIGAGRTNKAADYHFTGGVDDVAVWSTELSSAEITQLYNSGETLYAGQNHGDYTSSGSLTAYWTMDNNSESSNGSGTTLYGEVNNNDGSFEGAPSWSSVDFPGTLPTLSSSSPADNDTDVSIESNIVLNFSEIVRAGTGNITLKKTSDNSTVETFDINGGNISGLGSTQLTIDPTDFLDNSVEYYVLIDSTAVVDISRNSYAGISSTTALSFTTGAGNASNPFDNVDILGSVEAQTQAPKKVVQHVSTPVYNRLNWIRGFDSDEDKGVQKIKFNVLNPKLKKITNLLPQTINTNKIPKIFNENWLFWSEGSVSIGRVGDTINSSSKDVSTSALTLGWDKKNDNNSVRGYTFTYTQDNVAVGGAGSSVDLDSYSFSTYTTFNKSENRYIEGILGASKLDLSNMRKNGSNTLTGKRNGKQVFASFNYINVFEKDEINISPNIRLDMSYTKLSKYTESGSNALTYDEQTVETAGIYGGFTFNNEIIKNNNILRPTAGFELGLDLSPNSDVSLNYVSDPNTKYTKSIDQQGEKNVKGKVGFDLLTETGWSFMFFYERNQSDNSHSNTIYLMSGYISAREDEYAMVLEDNKASVEYKKNLNGFDVKFDTGYNLFSEYKDYEINLNVSSKF